MRHAAAMLAALACGAWDSQVRIVFAPVHSSPMMASFVSDRGGHDVERPTLASWRSTGDGATVAQRPRCRGSAAPAGTGTSPRLLMGPMHPCRWCRRGWAPTPGSRRTGVRCAIPMRRPRCWPPRQFEAAQAQTLIRRLPAHETPSLDLASSAPEVPTELAQCVDRAAPSAASARQSLLDLSATRSASATPAAVPWA